MDEIPTEDDRFQVTKAILQLAANRSIGHMLVASRDHAYVGRTMLPRPFRRFVVQAMRQEQITALIQRWCKAVYLPHKATDESKALQAEIAELEAIRKAQGEVPLVDTPLMVSIVAIVHYNERKLPQQRAALYEKCVNALLAEQHKGEEGEGQSDLEKREGSTDAKRGYLALLAYQMMSHSADKDGGRTISIERMRDWLLPEFERNEGSRAAQNRFESFRSAMCDRASILHERSEQIEFTHFTFQEFLCAYYLAVNESLTAITKFFQSKERTQQSWWREAILLTIGYLGKTAVAQSLKLVQNLLSSFPDPPAELAAAELAASGLLELEVPAPDLRRVAHDRLVNLLTNPTLTFPLPLRVQAGRTLSKLGDKRPGVGVIVRKDIKLPDIAWGEEVPVGMYTVGSNKDVDNNDTRKVKIEQPYRLSRYPITNIQFQCFVEAADCYEGNWWQGIPKSAQDFRNPAFPYDNHPRETVSWYQAVAFCRWLSDKLGYDIELPHEYEWEIAARYPDNRFYSWGNKFKIDKTNAEAGIGQTTAVGTYPSGKNETLELYDLSGNVWEQCHNKYQQPEDDAIDQSGARRVVRGGSWGNYRRAVSTVYRASSPPDGSNSHDGFRVVRRFHLKVSE